MRIRVAPASSASTSCSIDCASISMGRSMARDSTRERLAHAAGQARLVVLDLKDAVVERHGGPPPARTHFSPGVRSVGVVLRVSVTRPAAASTKRRVWVAMPESSPQEVECGVEQRGCAALERVAPLRAI